MNSTENTFKICGQSILAAALLLASAPTLAADYWLRSGLTSVTMTDGVTVPMWGFANCTANFASCSAPSVPGPALEVPAGDTTGLTVHLNNTLSEPVSLIINGQSMPEGSEPVWTDGTQGPRTAADQRVRSFTHEAAASNGTATYVWNEIKTGTYLYQSGTHPQVQVQMGLYGAMTSDGQAALVPTYVDLAYDRALTLLLSEIDPDLHEAVASGTYGTPAGPTSTLHYNPQYFLINGKSYESTDLPLASVRAGETILLRFLNAGLRTRVPMISNGYLRIIAEDGYLYPWSSNPRQQYTVFLPAAKTIDALYIAQAVAGQDARITISDRRLGLTTGQSMDGGMMAYLDVSADPGALPPTITVPAPGTVYYATQDEPFTLSVEGAFPPVETLGREMNNARLRERLASRSADLRERLASRSDDLRERLASRSDDLRERLDSRSADLRDRLARRATGGPREVVVLAPAGITYTLIQKPYGMEIDAAGLMTWVPERQQVGSHHASVRVTDEAGLYTTTSFSLEVAGIPNTAPIAVEDNYSVTVGEVLSVPAAQGFVSNDTDANGDILTAILHLDQTAGTVTSNVDGGFSYTPPSMGFAGLDIGVDVFTYRAYDGVDYSEPTTVTINVLANRPPVAVGDTARGAVFVATEVYSEVIIDVLRNDRDPDSAFDADNGIVPSSVTIVAEPANGVVMVDPTTGNISYTPNEGFNGVDTFRYNIQDAHGAISNTARVSLVIVAAF